MLNFKSDVSSKLKIGIKSFLLSIFQTKNRKYFNKQTELKSEAFLEINENLDVVKLIQKLKEIDKLKDLFLNENQREVFESFKKKTKISLLKKNKKVESEFQKRLSSLKISKKTRTNKKLDDVLAGGPKNHKAVTSLKEEGDKQKLNDRLMRLVDPVKITFFDELQKSLSLNTNTQFILLKKEEVKN